MLLTIDAIGSIVLVVLFWKLGFNARWYNGLMLFPVGMVFAAKEERMISHKKAAHLVRFVLSIFFLEYLGFYLLS